MTVVLMNNYIYGMTGGQVSPTTPVGKMATTAPFGNLEASFNISGLAEAAGAAFVARSTAYHVTQLENFIVKALGKKGFSVVEAMSPCPTVFGRRNKLRGGVEMLNDLKQRSVPAKKAAKMTADELQDKIVTGVLVDIDKPEYTAQYDRLIASLGS
jgi:2-oxoglutarate ferredoxin oxidoreductase subunit beta